MDKMYISKNELTKLIQAQRTKSGPILTALCLMWIISSLLVFIFPMLMYGMILLLLYIPFYFVDKFITERKN